MDTGFFVEILTWNPCLLRLPEILTVAHVASVWRSFKWYDARGMVQLSDVAVCGTYLGVEGIPASWPWGPRLP